VNLRFWRRRPKGVQAKSSGVLPCKCGASIEVSLEVCLPGVPADRFLQPMTATVQGVPCPLCARTYAMNLTAGGPRLRKVQ
jgi:hypothetical protein